VFDVLLSLDSVGLGGVLFEIDNLFDVILFAETINRF